MYAHIFILTSAVLSALGKITCTDYKRMPAYFRGSALVLHCTVLHPLRSVRVLSLAGRGAKLVRMSLNDAVAMRRIIPGCAGHRHGRLRYVGVLADDILHHADAF